MLQTLSKSVIQDLNSVKVSKLPTKLSKEAVKYPMNRSNKYLELNSTFLNTQMNIGPGGIDTYVVHESKGEADNTGIGTHIETQTNGFYEKSKVSLENLSISDVMSK